MHSRVNFFPRQIIDFIVLEDKENLINSQNLNRDVAFCNYRQPYLLADFRKWGTLAFYS